MSVCRNPWHKVACLGCGERRDGKVSLAALTLQHLGKSVQAVHEESNYHIRGELSCPGSEGVLCLGEERIVLNNLHKWIVTDASLANLTDMQDTNGNPSET